MEVYAGRPGVSFIMLTLMGSGEFSAQSRMAVFAYWSQALVKPTLLIWDNYILRAGCVEAIKYLNIIYLKIFKYGFCLGEVCYRFPST